MSLSALTDPKAFGAYVKSLHDQAKATKAANYTIMPPDLSREAEHVLRILRTRGPLTLREITASSTYSYATCGDGLRQARARGKVHKVGKRFHRATRRHHDVWGIEV